MSKSLNIKFILLITLSMFYSYVALSRPISNPKNWLVKVGHSRIYTFEGFTSSHDPNIKFGRASQFHISGLYYVSKYFAGGIYSAFATFPERKYQNNKNDIQIYSLGLRPQIFITPLLLPNVNTRFDIYASFKAGVRYVNTPTYNPKLFEPRNEFAVGGGFAWYPWKRVKIYYDYDYGKQANSNQKHMHTFGLGIRF